MKYLLILFVSLSAFAHEECVQHHVMPLKDNTVKNLTDPLQWFANSPAGIEKAPCRAKLPTEQEMDNLFVQNTQGPKYDRSINGITFRGETPQMLDLFAKLTSRYNYLGQPVATGVDFQNTFQINPACENVSCAIQKIWGDSLSLKLSYLYFKYGINSSEYAFPNSDRMTEEEIDDVIQGMRNLPDVMLPVVRQNQQVTHYKRGFTEYTPGDEKTQYKTVANSAVYLFDHWNDKPKIVRQYTLLHEMGHNIAFGMNEADRSPEWLAISGWEKTGDDWKITKTTCVVSKYGKFSPDEDFAESIASYRFNAKRLQKTCPEKYNYMKRIFRGVEYLTPKTCKASQP
jgi:hypothetical protein